MNNKAIVFMLIGGMAVLLLTFAALQVKAQDGAGVYLPLVWGKPLPPQSGWVVFDSDRDGDQEIYRMRYDGSEVTQLTFNTGVYDVSPDWSPDGEQIAYVSNLSGVAEIYVMDADGSNQLKLTEIGNCWTPQWSPDGTKIAFRCRPDDSNLIFTMNPDGSEQTQITPPEISGYDPYWSPDGNRIAFVSTRTDPGVYVIDADGTDQALLFLMNGLGQMAWSPDGRWFALTKVVEPNYNLDIFLYDLDAGTLIRLTTTTMAHNGIDWYPNGNYLIYSSNQDDLANFEIYTMTSSGTMVTNISNHPATDNNPDWIP
jgi:TolB protein